MLAGNLTGIPGLRRPNCSPCYPFGRSSSSEGCLHHRDSLTSLLPSDFREQSGPFCSGALPTHLLAHFNLFLEGPGWYYVSEIFPTHLHAMGMTINIIGLCCVDSKWLELAMEVLYHLYLRLDFWSGSDILHFPERVTQVAGGGCTSLWGRRPRRGLSRGDSS